jgi:GNAT superfamily N-acetyltransferase
VTKSHVSIAQVFSGIFYNKFIGGGLLIITLIFYNVSIGCNLVDRAKELAKQRGCKAVTLDSGLPRTGAHGFYEHYGFEKSCYGFELMI